MFFSILNCAILSFTYNAMIQILIASFGMLIIEVRALAWLWEALCHWACSILQLRCPVASSRCAILSFVHALLNSLWYIIDGCTISERPPFTKMTDFSPHFHSLSDLERNCNACSSAHFGMRACTILENIPTTK